MNKKAVEIERDHDYQQQMGETIYNLTKYPNLREKTITKLHEHDE